MILVSSCRCVCPIHWSQVLIRDWRCSWSSANRRCSKYIWVIANFISYWGASYIRGLTVFYYLVANSLGLLVAAQCLYSCWRYLTVGRRSWTGAAVWTWSIEILWKLSTLFHMAASHRFSSTTILMHTSSNRSGPFSQRQQRVVVNGYESTWYDVKSGIP